MNNGFEIVNICGQKDGMPYDSKTIFYDEKTGEIEGEYYYLNKECNYLLSWGFTKDSLGEARKTKAKKVKKPFFSIGLGWYK